MEQHRENNGILKRMYSVLDKKSGSWESPFCARTHGEAERIISGVVNDPQTIIGQYPEDFSLWHIASFNPVSGEVIPNKPYSLGEVVAFKQAKNQNNT